MYSLERWIREAQEAIDSGVINKQEKIDYDALEARYGKSWPKTR
jgi:hypothetical protein